MKSSLRNWLMDPNLPIACRRKQEFKGLRAKNLFKDFPYDHFGLRPLEFFQFINNLTIKKFILTGGFGGQKYAFSKNGLRVNSIF
jgi:hypothetical protein